MATISSRLGSSERISKIKLDQIIFSPDASDADGITEIVTAGLARSYSLMLLRAKMVLMRTWGVDGAILRKAQPFQFYTLAS